jgi:hypothetical protein
VTISLATLLVFAALLSGCDDLSILDGSSAVCWSQLTRNQYWTEAECFSNEFEPCHFGKEPVRFTSFVDLGLPDGHPGLDIACGVCRCEPEGAGGERE